MSRRVVRELHKVIDDLTNERDYLKRDRDRLAYVLYFERGNDGCNTKIR